MKQMFVFVICVLALAACNRKPVADDTATAGVEPIQWFVYSHPVKGYEVSIRAWYNGDCRGGMCYDCLITVFLKKEDRCYAVELPGAVDAFPRDTITGDTIYIDNPVKPDGQVCFDSRSVVSFADVNFDGEEEVIVCSNPSHGGEMSNKLNCGTYTIYKMTGDSLARIRNALFDELDDDYGNFKYVTYSFDQAKQTLTLVDSVVDRDVITAVSWFSRGELYKLDYTIESVFWNGNFLDKPEIIVYHFLFPQDAEKFNRVIDSLWRCI